MPANKKHHFVPRFYLKRFSSSGKSISIYHVPSKRKIDSGNLSNQCYRDYFYGKEPEVEKSLASIEASASRVLHQLLEGEYSALDQMTLILYIAIQHGRTTYTVDAINDMADKFAKHMLQYKFKELGADPEHFRIEYTKTSQLALIGAVIHHYLLLDLDMKIVRLSDGQCFITSDAPVILYNQFFQDDLRFHNDGFGSKGLMVFFPIDSKHLILLYDRNVYAIGGRSNGRVTNPCASDIDQINGLQIAAANESVYFLDSRFPVEDLSSRYSRFRSHEKMEFKTFPNWNTKTSRSEYVVSSRTSLKMDLNLSFVRTLKAARKWKAEFAKKELRPPIIPRNEPLYAAHEQFTNLVRENKIDPRTFPRWCIETLGKFPI